MEYSQDVEVTQKQSHDELAKIGELSTNSHSFLPHSSNTSSALACSYSVKSTTNQTSLTKLEREREREERERQGKRERERETETIL